MKSKKGILAATMLLAGSAFAQTTNYTQKTEYPFDSYMQGCKGEVYHMTGVFDTNIHVTQTEKGNYTLEAHYGFKDQSKATNIDTLEEHNLIGSQFRRYQWQESREVESWTGVDRWNIPGLVRFQFKARLVIDWIYRDEHMWIGRATHNIEDWRSNCEEKK